MKVIELSIAPEPATQPAAGTSQKLDPKVVTILEINAELLKCDNCSSLCRDSCMLTVDIGRAWSFSLAAFHCRMQELSSRSPSNGNAL